MPVVRIAFLNCWNCFAVGQVDRALQNPPALTKKIADLANTLSLAFGGEAPDVIGLCEIGRKSLARRVARLVAQADPAGPITYDVAWSGSPSVDQPGIALCYRSDSVVAFGSPKVSPDPAVDPRRARWMAQLFEFHRSGSRAPAWLVVNHWKSRRGGIDLSEADRLGSAYDIGDFFLASARLLCDSMIAIGDFNCEPGERPFDRQAVGSLANAPPSNRLRAARERDMVLREKNRLAYLYCPMWRFMGEPHPAELASSPVPATRLMGTYGAPVVGNKPGWLMFDQFLVTKRLLRGGALRFREGSLRIVHPLAGCSDHCAIAAEFEIQ